MLRPALPGHHIGEFVASRLLGIRLHESATTRASDGVFGDGTLSGRTVNVKLYGRDEGLLDLPNDGVGCCDFTLVLAGPRGAAPGSRGGTRPIRIASAYLFENERLIAALRQRGVKIGTATSVARHLWDEAEMYPVGRSAALFLSDRQRMLLNMFSLE